MNMSIAIQPVAQRTPGRLHLAIRGLEADPAWDTRLESRLGELPGLHAICASIASGSLLLRYDPRCWNTESLVEAIGRAIGRPWRFEAPAGGPGTAGGRLAIVAEATPVIRQICSGDTCVDLSRSRPMPSRHATPHPFEVDPLCCTLRIGALCYPDARPDAIALAFAAAARRSGLPVDAWLQQYQPIGAPVSGPFLTCFRRRGSQVLALARGRMAPVLDRCAFIQDRQGCHPLDAALRHRLEGEERRLSHLVAFAYRPLLFQQSPQTPVDDWIFAGFATLDWSGSQN